LQNLFVRPSDVSFVIARLRPFVIFIHDVSGSNLCRSARFNEEYHHIHQVHFRGLQGNAEMSGLRVLGLVTLHRTTGQYMVSAQREKTDFELLFIYRIIHKSLRDVRPLLYSSRDGHAKGEHVNRGRHSKFPSYLTGVRYVLSAQPSSEVPEGLLNYPVLFSNTCISSSLYTSHTTALPGSLK
jgi:hypothetical protein